MTASLQPTPSQTVGPFFYFGLCTLPQAELVPEGTEGAIELVGAVFDGAGDPVPDAMVEIRQADPDGSYRPEFGWGRYGTDADGSFRFLTVLPGLVPGPGGRLQPPHIWCFVFARGLLKPLLTRCHFQDGELAASDPLLAELEAAERSRLVAAPDGDARYRFDVHLQGERQTPFFVL